jgi:hypothetical protein
MTPSTHNGIDASTKVAAFGGLPLSALVVWWMQTFWLKPKGYTIDPAAATIAGGLGALILGELLKDIGDFYKLIVRKLLEKLR